jgi:putative FmdB family regulatory protein
MPLYEFVCQKCDREQELLVRGEEVPVCESCGSNQLTKLLSAPVAHSTGVGGGSAPSLPAGGCGSGCACHGG